jgi:hypothetical protein
MSRVSLAELVRQARRFERSRDEAPTLPERPTLIEQVARLFAATWPDVPFADHAAAARSIIEEYEVTLLPAASDDGGGHSGPAPPERTPLIG